MPTVPKNHKCRELGCKNPSTYRSCFCIEHGGGKTDKQKANSHLYSSKHWQQQRINQLNRQPLCARCLTLGKVTQAVHIDHVFPHRQDKHKFQVNVLQSLCPECHTFKTQEEAKGNYLHFTANGIKTYTDSDYVIVIREDTNGDTFERYTAPDSTEQRNQYTENE